MSSRQDPRSSVDSATQFLRTQIHNFSGQVLLPRHPPAATAQPPASPARLPPGPSDPQQHHQQPINWIPGFVSPALFIAQGQHPAYYSRHYAAAPPHVRPPHHPPGAHGAHTPSVLRLRPAPQMPPSPSLTVQSNQQATPLLLPQAHPLARPRHVSPPRSTDGSVPGPSGSVSSAPFALNFQAKTGSAPSLHAFTPPLPRPPSVTPQPQSPHRRPNPQTIAFIPPPRTHFRRAAGQAPEDTTVPQSPPSHRHRPHGGPPLPLRRTNSTFVKVRTPSTFTNAALTPTTGLLNAAEASASGAVSTPYRTFRPPPRQMIPGSPPLSPSGGSPAAAVVVTRQQRPHPAGSMSSQGKTTRSRGGGGAPSASSVPRSPPSVYRGPEVPSSFSIEPFAGRGGGQETVSGAAVEVESSGGGANLGDPETAGGRGRTWEKGRWEDDPSSSHAQLRREEREGESSDCRVTPVAARVEEDVEEPELNMRRSSVAERPSIRSLLSRQDFGCRSVTATALGGGLRKVPPCVCSASRSRDLTRARTNLSRSCAEVDKRAQVLAKMEQKFASLLRRVTTREELEMAAEREAVEETAMVMEALGETREEQKEIRSRLAHLDVLAEDMETLVKASRVRKDSAEKEAVSLEEVEKSVREKLLLLKSEEAEAEVALKKAEELEEEARGLSERAVEEKKVIEDTHASIVRAQRRKETAQSSLDSAPEQKEISSLEAEIKRLERSRVEVSGALEGLRREREEAETKAEMLRKEAVERRGRGLEAERKSAMVERETAVMRKETAAKESADSVSRLREVERMLAVVEHEEGFLIGLRERVEDLDTFQVALEAEEGAWESRLQSLRAENLSLDRQIGAVEAEIRRLGGSPERNPFKQRGERERFFASVNTLPPATPPPSSSSASASSHTKAGQEGATGSGAPAVESTPPRPCAEDRGDLARTPPEGDGEPPEFLFRTPLRSQQRSDGRVSPPSERRSDSRGRPQQQPAPYDGGETDHSPLMSPVDAKRRPTSAKSASQTSARTSTRRRRPSFLDGPGGGAQPARGAGSVPMGVPGVLSFQSVSGGGRGLVLGSSAGGRRPFPPRSGGGGSAEPLVEVEEQVGTQRGGVQEARERESERTRAGAEAEGGLHEFLSRDDLEELNFLDNLHSSSSGSPSPDSGSRPSFGLPLRFRPYGSSTDNQRTENSSAVGQGASYSQPVPIVQLTPPADGQGSTSFLLSSTAFPHTSASSEGGGREWPEPLSPREASQRES
uniref:Uncharacterized protein n=1 Tax=Chromera velia CCMP2878 TaxID=1169474 RepID=A0A0G4G277_9ALVE|eukprot:Cvel_19901.t1-p1 / transcript=Cvel_19901.t1 / gene=Cvel_19901 / organism=Chromera_velia_CCMP2878 / gene_product=hypothetical protein / transcript_product=hypothetical protein / location=Cvel_scaffold1748:7479-12755(+) / protein_length=1246 / sequence_SO=supercontig / SO=protein_coding / is_pseudo=false